MHVWLFTEYMPTLHWWIGASSISPYVITIAWGSTSDIIIHHWSIAYELFTYCSSLILLFCCYCYNYYKNPKTFIFTFATITFIIIPLLLLNTLLQILSYPGVVELKTQLLILRNILWLPLCRISKFGLNTLPSKAVAIPYTCGLSPPGNHFPPRPSGDGPTWCRVEP